MSISKTGWGKMSSCQDEHWNRKWWSIHLQKPTTRWYPLFMHSKCISRTNWRNYYTCNLFGIVKITQWAKQIQFNVQKNSFQVDSCSKFWFQPLNEKERVKKYSEILNDPQFAKYYQSVDSNKIDKRLMLVVRDRKSDRLLRAQVCNVDRSGLREPKFIIQFIDFGHKQECSSDELYTLKLKDDELL